LLRYKMLSLFFAAALVAAGATVPARALDSSSEDADGDLVADAPIDHRQFINFAMPVFGYTPVEAFPFSMQSN